MGECFQMRFPGGLRRALTFSYDDNVIQNKRLADLLRANGMKGTFNLNGGLMEGTPRPGSRRMPKDEIYEMFKDGYHEVAVHGYTHPYLASLPSAVCTYDVMKDRLALEQMFGRVITGMAYPMGSYSDSVVDCLKSCGISYARTVVSTENFSMPEDWLRLPATCHHNNPRLMDLAKRFVEGLPPYEMRPRLFYLWGHSYEFDDNDNWNVIEEFVSYMAKWSNKIWFATNMEIYEYVQDYKRLVFAADGSMVYNPTARTLFFRWDDRDCSVAPGETLKIF